MQRCPHCSEALDGLVPICWHCGHAVEIHPVPSERKEFAREVVPDPASERSLFDQLWFEDDLAAAPAPATTGQEADLETWSTLGDDLDVPIAALPEPSSSTQPPIAAVPHSTTTSSFEAPPAFAAPRSFEEPPAVAPAVVQAESIKPSARPRWQLPAIGFAGVGTVVVVMSLMGRPASNASAPAAPASAPPVASAPPTLAPATSASPAPVASAPPPATPAAPPAAAKSTAVVEIEEAPEWIVPRRTNYGPDGSRTLTLQLAALSDVPAGRERVRPVLAVRCLSRRTDVFVSIGTSVKPEGNDSHTVSIQFDDEAPTTEKWPGSASYQELFAPDGVVLARRLATTRLWRFTFTPYASRPVAVEFNVQDFDRHVSSIARMCGWPGQDAAATRRR